LPVFADFEKSEGFVSGLDFFLPAVNRFDGWENVRTRRKALAHQLVRNPARDFRVWKCAQREQDFFSHVLRRYWRLPPANPAAAEHNATVVNDRSLSGRYGTLRVVQSHVGAIVLQ
jgi:ribosomal protein L39E